ncbi:hypothetical protein NLU13_3186 [Sarocladium strictum]|uniref:Uncharacterized protein n=1 Tax=Sarocladium strictum TaxID=5046 RepID=A0AA39L9H7_SARSR|nr:hypothetical protein NLU13_3186 [Sarocladium strictum]
MANHEGLEPPKDPSNADPGARQLAESSDSEDQFTDAQSGPASPSVSPPVPKTRVERVDDEPAHGEVAGTDAHEKRLQDAKPDEIAVIPESDDTSTPRAEQPSSATNIPTTVVEESAGDLPGPHSAEFEAKREADASPDVIVTPDGTKKAGEESSPETTVANQDGKETSPPDETEPPAVQSEYAAATASANETQANDGHDFDDDDDDDNDNEGDDFDDFEEGDEDEDFDDFEDGFQQAEPAPPMPAPLPEVELPFPIPDFDGLSPDDIVAATEPYLASLFPPEHLNFPDFPPINSKAHPIFSTDRSASLWSQLVAPPPLAPPDWIRSRTRRLFLVSLGVPVDLDEILPASKQKKLVLPSLNIPTSASPRTSSDSRSLSRIRQEGGGANASSTSVDTQGRPSSKSKGGKKGSPPQPDLDLVSARHLCMTTSEALDGMTEEELKEHVSKLEAMQGKAKELLEYWQKRADEKIGDREAFEGVIENLVKHARKVRK